MNEDDQSDDTACHNPQCVLEDYLTDISQPPKLPSKEIPEKLPKETMSPNKENVPPISNQVCKDLKKFRDMQCKKCFWNHFFILVFSPCFSRNYKQALNCAV